MFRYFQGGVLHTSAVPEPPLNTSTGYTSAWYISTIYISIIHRLHIGHSFYILALQIVGLYFMVKVVWSQQMLYTYTVYFIAVHMAPNFRNVSATHTIFRWNCSGKLKKVFVVGVLQKKINICRFLKIFLKM
jgi:hypothetical protein